MARTHANHIAEANYSLASAQLQLANAQNQIKVLEIQCSSLQDSVDTTRAEYEVLLSQLAEERCSSDGLKTELARLQRALWKAAHALDVADSKMQRPFVHGEAAERDSKRDAGARDSSADALELAEAKLVAAARRETSLQERLFIERAAKETAENALAAKGHVSCVPVFEGSPQSGKIIAFSPEQHTKLATSSVEDSILRQENARLDVENFELRRLMAGYNASVTTLKEQLEAVEKRLSKHEPTLELPDTSRTAELDLHAQDQLHESDSTISMLAALRRKLEERNAELLDERKITFQMRTDISQMISELGDVKSQFLTRLPNMARVTGKHEVGEPDKPKHCTDKPLDSDPCTYKKGSPLPDKTVQETVVNVIDHLSLSGYVSPLRQTKNNSRARYSKCRPLSASGSRDVVNGTRHDINVVVVSGLEGNQKNNSKFDVTACTEPSHGVGTARIPLEHLGHSSNAPVAPLRGARNKKRRKLLEQGAIPGSDTVPTSLLFGCGDGFHMQTSKS